MSEKSIRDYFEICIRDDFVRAGFDPTGTVGLAQVHIMSEEIIRLRNPTPQTHMWIGRRMTALGYSTTCGLHVTDKEVSETWEYVTCKSCLDDAPTLSVNRRAEAIAATKAKYD